MNRWIGRWILLCVSVLKWSDMQSLRWTQLCLMQVQHIFRKSWLYPHHARRSSQWNSTDIPKCSHLNLVTIDNQTKPKHPNNMNRLEKQQHTTQKQTQTVVYHYSVPRNNTVYSLPRNTTVYSLPRNTTLIFRSIHSKLISSRALNSFATDRSNSDTQPPHKGHFLQAHILIQLWFVYISL